MTRLRYLLLSDQLAADDLSGSFSLKPVEYMEWALDLEEVIEQLKRRIDILETGDESEARST